MRNNRTVLSSGLFYLAPQAHESNKSPKCRKQCANLGLRSASREACKENGEMRTIINQFVKLASLAVVISVTAVVGSAQTSGTVTINGSVAKSAAIRWWSYTALNSEGGVNAPNTQNSPLAFTLSL